MNNDNLHNLRTDYVSEPLTREDLHANPMEQFKMWFQKAQEEHVPEPNVFVLASVGNDLQPSARVVLIKEIRNEGIVFYTNYTSKKGNQIAENKQVAACFFWQPLFRQVRIEGICEKISPEESDHYFYKRPVDSQIAACISPQSQEIAGREWLLSKWEAQKNQPVKRPEHWGGYLIKINQIEFWQGQASRLHNRFIYQKDENGWEIKQLAP